MLSFAVASNTWKQFVRDRIFYIVLLVALFMLGFSYLLSTLTIVESRKILLDFGFAAASLAGVITAIFLGIVSMAKEIENRTIYTVVSKPVSRTTYVIGKFLGAGSVLFVTHVLFALNILFILFTQGERAPVGFTSCLWLIFAENILVLGLAFLFSMITNSSVAAALTLSIFLIGRSSLTFQTIAERATSEATKFFARGMYYVVPNLERFNIRDVVAYEKGFPESMLWIGSVYSLGYCLVCLVLTCRLFERKDLP